MDESGDLGFKNTSSKWFVFVILLVPDKRILEKAVKKVWSTIHRKHKTMGELHAFRENNVTKKRMFKRLALIKDLRVLSIAVNKQKFHSNSKNDLYNTAAGILLNKLRPNGVLTEKEGVEIYIDKKDRNRRFNKDFEEHLIQSLVGFEQEEYSVKLHTSHENKSLQAADFIAWAMFRKYEKSDYEHYETIKSKIIEEFVLFA